MTIIKWGVAIWLTGAGLFCVSLAVRVRGHSCPDEDELADLRDQVVRLTTDRDLSRSLASRLASENRRLEDELARAASVFMAEVLPK